MKFSSLFICLLAIQLQHTLAQLPKVYIMDPQRLSEVKKAFQRKDKTAVLLIWKLEEEAQALLHLKPLSVMEKSFTPVSGNKHDYMSQAPYFWYDSSKTNGLPYLRRDGVRNPEINKITDKKNLVDLENATKTLALAWYFTGNERYAAKASSLIRTWFLDEATSMNPHLDYAQGIPGINSGRGIGIIESRSFTAVADAVGLLEGSTSWNAKDTESLKAWYREFLHWMLTSKNGRDEHVAKNNHGTWYYVQAIDFALFTGDRNKATELAKQSISLLDSQLAADGTQPLELDRTKGLGYSTMNLKGWFEVARLAEQVGVDVWNYKTSKGSGLQSALNWLLPYATGEKTWGYQQIEPYNKSDIYPLLLQAANKYDASYASKAASIRRDNGMMDLLYRK